MIGLEFARAYIDDLLVITTGPFDNHLADLEKVLSRLSEAGLKVNTTKSFFGRTELEYLGYWITQEGVKPLSKKVEAITNLAAPKTRKQVRSFIGLVNHYRDMWGKRSEILAPLTALTSIKVKETVILATVVGAKKVNPDMDYFPLSVNYQEKYYAGGKIPGGYFKREARPTESEQLISRLIDRPIRPLFPSEFKNEVQLLPTVISYDKDNQPDILAITASSAALAISGME